MRIKSQARLVPGRTAFPLDAYGGEDGANGRNRR